MKSRLSRSKFSIIRRFPLLYNTYATSFRHRFNAKSEIYSRGTQFGMLLKLIRENHRSFGRLVCDAMLI